MVGSQETATFQIADLTVDCGRREVRRNGRVLDVPKLSFDVLLALIQESPNAMTIDQLMDRVWSGKVVNPETVTKRLELLRNALGDDSSDPKYIGLLRGHGYRLIPKVKPADTGSSNFKVTFAAVFALLAIALTWTLINHTREVSPKHSIAVLPFLSLSEAPDDEYFADGLSEELSHALANVEGLKVTGRTSSFFYKGKNEDLRKIGQELGVANVLEGSVRRSGDTIRITAQLINAEDGYHLWSQTYDRNIKDLIAIQQDIATHVVDELRIELMPEVSDLLNPKMETDPDTYLIYLKALNLSQSLALNLSDAQELVEEVLARDPDFAPGWTLLGVNHVKSLVGGLEDYKYGWVEGWREVKKAIERSEAIEPEQGQLKAIQGVYTWVFEQNPQSAAPYFEEALRLSTSDLDVVMAVSSFAKHIGRLQDAQKLEEFMVNRDPLCTRCLHSLAKTSRYNRQLEKAEKNIRKFQALVGRGGGERSLGIVLIMQGRYQEAIESFNQFDHHLFLRDQGIALAKFGLGDVTGFDADMKKLVQQWGDKEPWVIAEAFAYAGRADDAFYWLEKSARHRPMDMQTVHQEPLYENIHKDPRWQIFLSRIGSSKDQLATIEFNLAELIPEIKQENRLP
ncbi:MAG: winged helix-turn-helix domain-containing protein [Pseudomonadota bacterium]